MTGWMMDDGWMDMMMKRNETHDCIYARKELATTHDKPILRLSIQTTTRNTNYENYTNEQTTTQPSPRPTQRIVFHISVYFACPSSSHSVLFCFSPFLLLYPLPFCCLSPVFPDMA